MKFDYNRLRGERVARGMTQAELGSQIGIKEPSYSKVERGLRGLDVDRLCEILTIMGVEVKDIPIFFTQEITDTSNNYN